MMMPASIQGEQLKTVSFASDGFEQQNGQPGVGIYMN